MEKTTVVFLIYRLENGWFPIIFNVYQKLENNITYIMLQFKTSLYYWQISIKFWFVNNITFSIAVS